MKKSLVLLVAIMLAMGLLLSCSDSGGDDDVESALQGTWAVNPAAYDNDYKIYLIMTADSFEADQYEAPEIPSSTTLNVGSSKGSLKAKNGVFTTTTTHYWDGASWAAMPGGPVDSTDTYVLNSSTSVTIIGDWDSTVLTADTAETFTKQ